MEVPILLAGEQVIKLDVVDSAILILLSKNTMKLRNLTVNTSNDTACLVFNDKLKEIELYTSASEH